MRTWTPRNTVEPANPSEAPGTVASAPFRARLIFAYGEDYGKARRTVILETPEGCRRQFRAESFSDPDGALIDREVSRHPFAPDPAEYGIDYREGLTTPELLASGRLAIHTTQHFAFWYGRDTRGEFYRTIAENGHTIEDVVREAGESLEKQWQLYRHVLGAPMPYTASADRRKLNVFLCGTGRPVENSDDLQGCNAGAARDMGVSAAYLVKGSNVLAHELGHMVQSYTGGFHNRREAGPIWETGAEWSSFAINPSFDPSSSRYFGQLENGFLFSPVRYGAAPIMAYLFEKDETRSLVFGAWLHDLRDADGISREDFIPAVVRLGKASGIYPLGYASFADDAGWYGARLVAMDFLNQRAMRDSLRPTPASIVVPHLYTPLNVVAGGGDPGVFTPPRQRSLLQWGTHIVPLTPTSRRVTVTLTGDTVANQAAWRFTLVAVDDEDRPYYAPLGAVTGRGSARVAMTPPKGMKLFLAVTATPYAYETLGWQENGKPIRGTQFPYHVQIEGAEPLIGKVEACNPNTGSVAWNVNYRLSGNSEMGGLIQCGTP